MQMLDALHINIMIMLKIIQLMLEPLHSALTKVEYKTIQVVQQIIVTLMSRLDIKLLIQLMVAIQEVHKVQRTKLSFHSITNLMVVIGWPLGQGKSISLRDKLRLEI